MNERFGARLAALAAEALVAVLPEDAAGADWLFGGPAGVGQCIASPDGADTAAQEKQPAAAPRLPAWHRQPPVDQQLGFWLRRHPSLGPRERRWLSDRVHDVLRNGRAYEAFLRDPAVASPIGLPDLALCLIRLSAQRAVVATAAATPDATPDASPAEPGRAAGADDLATAFGRWQAGQPPAVRYSLPEWFWALLVASHGEDSARTLAASLLQPASIDIRCNLLKGKPAALQELLAAEGIAAAPVPGVPTALRLIGRPALTRLPLFQSGWFEPQDAGSQLIAETCAARRGERIIDFCAGAGGKTLALAARMRNQGQILAFDTDDRRLAKIEPRLQRAGVSIVNWLRLDGSSDPRLQRYARWADLVLLDAPCSGSGTIRRHPDLKWRLLPEDIAGHQRLQQEIFRAALALLRPGGRLVYATCSLFAPENQGHEPAFARMAASAGQGGSRLSLASSRYWLPDAQGGDGYFMAVWQTG